MKNQCCAYCKKETGDFHRDHVVPRSRGGPDTASNIVMACSECNIEKSDQTATEWLGEECPDNVRSIEETVNRKLKAIFEKRDYKKTKYTKQEELYCYSINEQGGASYIGKVISEIDGVIRMEVIDALVGYFGVWSLSGQIENVPADECKLFTEKLICLRSALHLNESICKTDARF